jgi:predicted nucleotidyltransferase
MITPDPNSTEHELVSRSFRDRDFIVTPEGFIFTVIGNLHPSDRVIAYLKYVPDKRGQWGLGVSRYRRVLEHYNVPSVMDSMEFLREKAPQYIFESIVDGILLPAVPTNRIARHLCPEMRLSELRNAQERDELEMKALRLTELISRKSGVPQDSLGLTGSVLARIHNVAFSDLDLVVYEYDNAIRVKAAIEEMMDSRSGTIRRLAGTYREKWIAERLRSTPLARRSVVTMLARKWNNGSFCRTGFSIHPVHTEAEIGQHYGDEMYTSLGIVDATARIASSKESLFMPAIYQVESVDFRGSHIVSTVDQIVSYEGLYADIATEGETVSCRGKLERIQSSSGIRHRILIGSPEAQGTDYLLPLLHHRPGHFFAS